MSQHARLAFYIVHIVVQLEVNATAVCDLLVRHHLYRQLNAIAYVHHCMVYQEGGSSYGDDLLILTR